MNQGSGWVIERHYGSVLHYWTGRAEGSSQWSVQHDEAIRFARRTDAESMLTWHCGQIGRVAEHLWTGRDMYIAEPAA